MGYYSKYFATLLKGLNATVLKQRFETRRLVNNLNKVDKIVYKKLNDEVEHEHKVTRSLKDEDKAISELKKSAGNAYKLIFNIITEEQQALQYVDEILNILHSLPKSDNLKKIEQQILLEIKSSLKKAESQGREEYKQVMLIIDEAADKDKNKFMANIKLAFQDEKTQSLLTKFAMRSEIKSIQRDIINLGLIKDELTVLKVKLEKGHIKRGSDQKEMEVILAQVRKYMKDTFYNIFLLMKRDLLMTLKILFDLNNLRTLNIKWVQLHFMPSEPVRRIDMDIDKLEKEISDDFHVIAQGFRIDIKKIESLEAKSN